MDRRWNKKVVSRVSSVTVVMRLPIIIIIIINQLTCSVLNSRPHLFHNLPLCSPFSLLVINSTTQGLCDTNSKNHSTHVWLLNVLHLFCDGKHYSFVINKMFRSLNIHVTSRKCQRQTYCKELNFEDDKVKTHGNYDGSDEPQIPPRTHHSQRLILRYAAISQFHTTQCTLSSAVRIFEILNQIE